LTETGPEDSVDSAGVLGGSTWEGDAGEVGGWGDLEWRSACKWELCRAGIGWVERWDELGGQAEHGVEAQRGVIWDWVGALLQSCTDVG